MWSCFSNVWSENTALFERLMEIHSNAPKLYYGFNSLLAKIDFWHICPLARCNYWHKPSCNALWAKSHKIVLVKKDKTFSWSAESAAHRQKTPINLCSTCLNDVFSCNNVKWLNISMYITYGRVFGGTPNILIFGLFLENESNLEWTMNRAFIVHTGLGNHALTTKNVYLLIFRHHIPKLSCGFNPVVLLIWAQWHCQKPIVNICRISCCKLHRWTSCLSLLLFFK